MNRPKCDRPKCNRNAKSRGLCADHHHVWLLATYGPEGPKVDGEPTRERIRQLRAEGMADFQIALMAGLAKATIYAVMHRSDGMVRLETHEAIMGVQSAKRPLLPGDVVDPTGTRRRLRALVSMGFTNEFIANAIGMDPRGFPRVLNRDDTLVLRRVAEAVAAAYARHYMDDDPVGWVAERARRRAARAGWRGPWAWDDDTIDDPAAEPWDPPVPRELTFVERYEDLLDMGHDDPDEIAEVLGITFDALRLRLIRAEYPTPYKGQPAPRRPEPEAPQTDSDDEDEWIAS